jgi:hypothetical protein
MGGTLPDIHLIRDYYSESTGNSKNSTLKESTSQMST